MNYQLQKFQAKAGSFYLPLVILALSIFILFVGYSNVQPRQYSFNLNQVAEETIQSPVTIEDIEQTEINRERARNSVADVYVFQPNIAEEQISLLEQYFAFISTLRAKEYSIEEINNILEDYNQDLSLEEDNDDLNGETILFGELSDSEKLIVYQTAAGELNNNLEELALELPEAAILSVLSATEEDLARLKSNVNDILSNVLSSEIETVELNRVASDAENRIMSSSIPNDQAVIIRDLALELIVPTVVFSESETMKKREEAAQAVAPSYILQGQIVVQEGHIVNENTLRQLDVIGYLNQRTSSHTAILFILLIIVHAILLHFVVSKFSNSDESSDKNIAITAYSVLFASGYLMLKVFYFVQANGINYAMMLFPIYVFLLLLIPRTNQRIGLFFGLFFNLFALFIIHDGGSMTVTFIIAVFYLFSTFISYSYFIFGNALTFMRDIFNFALIGYVIFILPIVAIINITIISEPSLIVFAYAFINLMFSMLIYFFLEPYWNSLLNNKAPLTLNQLSDLNHPLLKRLIERSPGSYHHSMLVASLSSNAAESIGADSLLARVSSYYHDIGKTVHPLFFIENIGTGMESPHTMIGPEESAQIIISHVTEGRKILQEHNMPQSVIDICMQHHGTTLVRYFYHQASQDKTAKVDEALFTYPGPVPQTKEAMIVMIADSVEAASRTLKDHSQESIEGLVNNIVQAKIDEQQFVDSNITVDELLKIRKSLIKSIASMYHTRIDYPE